LCRSLPYIDIYVYNRVCADPAPLAKSLTDVFLP
jgi:hypothetical protein